MPQAYTSLHCHIVFAVRGRRTLLAPEIRPRLYAFVGGVIRKRKGMLLAAGGTADHVHLLALLHPRHAVSDVLRDVKAASSKWIHERFPDRRGFAWQDGYGAFAVSISNLPRVKGYITDQERRHRRLSFREELIRLLKAHGVDYDERYLSA